MTSNNEVYGKYRDESGEAYYCPINAVSDNHIISEWELDDCVDAATVERYSGNIDFKKRNLG